MAEVGKICIKYLMFFFNLIFTICGLALIVTGAVAQTDYRRFNELLTGGTIWAPAFIIVLGVVIFFVAFLGCYGAIKESYCMLMTFATLLGVVFVLQASGGIAGYVEKKHISQWVQKDLSEAIDNYYQTADNTLNDVFDIIQSTDECCGANNFTDFKTPLSWDNATIVPKSCCRNSKVCDRTVDYIAAQCLVQRNDSSCPIFTNGCQSEIENLLSFGISTVAGTALALAFVELIGIAFACFLARKIRAGYSYI